MNDFSLWLAVITLICSVGLLARLGIELGFVAHELAARGSQPARKGRLAYDVTRWLCYGAVAFLVVEIQLIPATSKYASGFLCLASVLIGLLSYSKVRLSIKTLIV